LATIACLSNENIASRAGDRRIVSVDKFNLTLQPLSIRMGQVKREDVLGIDLFARINLDGIKSGKRSQIPDPAGVRVNGVLICHSSRFFPVTPPGFLLQHLKIIYESMS
jgi:hypothetical protein